ncbi:MAG: dTDP-4-dehydrorhamnose 3,5-epimerase [Fidelibacterota bacterium]|nr:MAG: dTDP-4-dehydrorhamnose 3,5-epimerase [Candidatus Neomarinimicrobiota bacterium]
MKAEHTSLPDVYVLVPDIYEDARGFLMESYRKDVFQRELGIDPDFVQDIHSQSTRNVVRGLHFQWDPPMGKLMRVTVGKAFLVTVDIRTDSPTIGQWFGLEVSAHNRKQIWAPAGFARGFCALTDRVEVQYKCTATYNPDCESGIRWDDPDIGIQWPIDAPMLSEKDRNAQTLAQWLARPEARQFTL